MKKTLLYFTAGDIQSNSIYCFIKGNEVGHRLFLQDKIRGEIADASWTMTDMNTPSQRGTGTFGRRITRDQARTLAGNKFFNKIRQHTLTSKA